MSTAATANRTTTPKTAAEAPPKKDLSGLIPYLRRYAGSIVFGLIVVVLMGVVGNFIPLAIGIMTDTLAGSTAPFQNTATATAHLGAALPHLSTLSRSIP